MVYLFEFVILYGYFFGLENICYFLLVVGIEKLDDEVFVVFCKVVF